MSEPTLAGRLRHWSVSAAHDRAANTTSAPSEARPSAMSLPKPRLLPVTIARVPAKSRPTASDGSDLSGIQKTSHLIEQADDAANWRAETSTEGDGPKPELQDHSPIGA